MIPEPGHQMVLMILDSVTPATISDFVISKPYNMVIYCFSFFLWMYWLPIVYFYAFFLIFTFLFCILLFLQFTMC